MKCHVNGTCGVKYGYGKVGVEIRVISPGRAPLSVTQAARKKRKASVVKLWVGEDGLLQSHVLEGMRQEKVVVVYRGYDVFIGIV